LHGRLVAIGWLMAIDPPRAQAAQDALSLLGGMFAGIPWTHWSRLRSSRSRFARS